MAKQKDLKARIAGPIASIHTPFRRDGSVDQDSLRKHIDFVIEAGAGTLILTYGDSLFSILNDQEVGKVTKTAAEQVKGRAVLVAADRSWWTGRTIEFARFAREVRADALMVLPPDWAQSCTVETLVEHYRTIAEHMPVMMVSGVFMPRGVDGALQIVKAVLEQVDGVVAIKDDFLGAFGHRMCLLAKGRVATFAGGQKENHLDLLPYGCDGYLSTFITFKPSITHDYWKAVKKGDIAKATEIVRRYDIPFFDYVLKLPGSCDAGIHAAMELAGIMPRWRRPPYYDLSEEEMDKLKAFLKKLGVL